MANDYYIPRERENPLKKVADMMTIQKAMGEAQQTNALSKYLQSGVDLRSDEGIMGLMKLDPVKGMKLLQSKATIGATQALDKKYQAQAGQVGAKQLAGMAAELATRFKSQPPEQQTLEAWRSTWLPARQFAIDRGLATPDMIPEDATPDQVLAYVGPGFSPAEQAEAQVDEGDLARKTAYSSGRLGQYQQGIENLETNRANVLAQDQSQFRSREGRLGSEFRAREGNIDARSLRRVQAGGGGSASGKAPSGYRWTESGDLEEIPGGPATKSGAGFEMSYDAEGRPVVSMGGSKKPFTGEQAKALANITLAEKALKDMDDLDAEEFDPASTLGAAGVAAAGTTGLNMFAPEKAQRQNAANIAFAQSINYQRSGAATPEPEYKRAVQSVIPKLGDKPEAKAAKRNYRIALVEAVKAQDPRIDLIVQNILGKKDMGDNVRMPKGFRGASNQGTPAVSNGGASKQGATAESPEDAIKRLTGM